LSIAEHSENTLNFMNNVGRRRSKQCAHTPVELSYQSFQDIGSMGTKRQGKKIRQDRTTLFCFYAIAYISVPVAFTCRS
jgi:hypothetical protein